jgi:hypothetical protein
MTTEFRPTQIYPKRDVIHFVPTGLLKVGVNVLDKASDTQDLSKGIRSRLSDLANELQREVMHRKGFWGGD